MQAMNKIIWIIMFFIRLQTRQEALVKKFFYVIACFQIVFYVQCSKTF